MINIIKFDTYRDGGTISMKCNISFTHNSLRDKYLSDHHLSSDEMEICLDGRFGKEPKIWLGYPGDEDSKIIDDRALIEDILKKIESYKQNQNYKIDQFLDYDSKVRDWKIKNVLDDEKKA